MNDPQVLRPHVTERIRSGGRVLRSSTPTLPTSGHSEVGPYPTQRDAHDEFREAREREIGNGRRNERIAYVELTIGVVKYALSVVRL